MTEGDLTVAVAPKSERDVLGNSFHRLVSELFAQSLASTAEQLNRLVEQFRVSS